MSKRSRFDIDKGDRVRLEHTLRQGTVMKKNPNFGGILTVRMDDGGEITTFLAAFVPVVEKDLTGEQ